ncbi:MAG: type II toxin-antitoxin system VapC family toxin [Myxococcota bacterium]|nr:type II toxin-antitoxin system VapC family toxin [Myxococcota bacterium]
MRYVVDTNIAIAMLAQRQPVLQRLSTVAPEEVGLSVLVVAELLFGARRSARVKENVGRVQALEAQLPALPVTRPIVERYGIVRAELAGRGLAKSDFDLVIACTALEHGATLVTNDGALKDGAIAGLVVEDWLS